jgi:MoaA/NifB/PqqE/SkfB family radical SAM enzyme
MYLKRLLGVKLLAGRDTDKIMENVRQSQLQSILYKLGSQFLIDRDFPLHLYFELSRLCNYNCPMCMRREAPAGGHFPEELADKITAEAAKKGPTSYSLHLYGEPLMNPAWDKIVATIRRAHPYNAILLTTNGFFLTENVSRKLLELGVNRIFVSMHSFDPEVYRNYTRGGDISVVLNNIRTFAKLPGRSSRTKLFIRLFHGPDDSPFVPDYIDSLRALGIRLEIRGYHNFAGGRDQWSTFKKERRRWPCFHPWFTLGVAVDGTTIICCADARLGTKVGNAFEQTLEEIWKSEAVETIRREHLKNQFERWKACEPCDTWKFHPDIFFSFQRP